MKQTYPLFILLTLSHFCSAQTSDFTLTFEDTAVVNRVYYTDSLLDPAGIWQIGKPNKPFFDSAYNSTNAVVTLLDSSLPAGTKASFVISVPTYQVNSGPVYGAMLTFSSKVDFDSLHGGALVEFSIDSGIHWHGIFTTRPDWGFIVDDNGGEGLCFGTCQPTIVDHQDIRPPSWWHNVPKDTTSNGVAYFTGTDSTWMQDTIVIPNGCFILKTNELNAFILKFTAFTDSTSMPKAGWIIDNIKFDNNPYICVAGINEVNSSHLSISPNPVSNAYTISLTDETGSEYAVEFYDLMGREMMRRNFTGKEVTLHREGLAAGSYIIKVTNERTQDTFEKRVVFE